MDRAGEPWRWRPEPWWLLMPLLGTAAGGLFGVLTAVVVMVGEAGGLDGSGLDSVHVLLALAGVFGAAYGLMCGVPVGLVLMLLVGRDMPGPHAGRLAFLGAAGTQALALSLVFPGWWSPEDADFLLPVVVGSAFVAGVVAVWFGRRLPGRPRLAVHAAD